jgi:hypothetical protein
VVKRGLDIAQLIQVCVDVSNPRTRQRETRGLLKAANELRCKMARANNTTHFATNNLVPRRPHCPYGQWSL